ncbi:MAG: hypothetical protein E7212_00995 [Clostridium sartagoforme]|nr:hypothetical protein [Clostridium sartagoforme]
MIKCLYCGEELKKITSIGLEVGNFFLKAEERKRKISISFGNKKIGDSDSKSGNLDENFHCEKCNKAFSIYNLF